MADNMKQLETEDKSRTVGAPVSVTPPAAEAGAKDAATVVANQLPLPPQAYCTPPIQTRLPHPWFRRSQCPAPISQTHVNSYHIRVRSSMGIACRVRVRETDKISSVLLTVSSFTGVSPSRLQLILRKTGKELTEGYKTLKDYNIVDGDVIHMMPRLRSGPLGSYPMFYTLCTEDDSDSDSESIPQSLSVRLRKLDETQEELEAVFVGDEIAISPFIPAAEAEGPQVTPVEEAVANLEKDKDHENTRKRMLELKEKMQKARDTKRRKL